MARVDIRKHGANDGASSKDIGKRIGASIDAHNRAVSDSRKKSAINNVNSISKFLGRVEARKPKRFFFGGGGKND